jgi:hypothetical protein
MYRRQEQAFATQHAEVRERALNAGELLAGSPGSLKLRQVTGGAKHWYRVFYPVAGKATEKWVSKDVMGPRHTAVQSFGRGPKRFLDPASSRRPARALKKHLSSG